MLVVALLIATSPTVEYATYFGGAAPEFTDFGSASAVAVRADGYVAFGGSTRNMDFPQTSTVTRVPGDTEAWVALFDPEGALVWSVLFGGSEGTGVGAMTFDTQGDLVVVGATQSLGPNQRGVVEPFPVTQDAWLDENYPSDRTGLLNGYLARMSAADGSISYATFVGPNVFRGRGTFAPRYVFARGGEYVVAGRFEGDIREDPFEYASGAFGAHEVVARLASDGRPLAMALVAARNNLDDVDVAADGTIYATITADAYGWDGVELLGTEQSTGPYVVVRQMNATTLEDGWIKLLGAGALPHVAVTPSNTIYVAANATGGRGYYLLGNKYPDFPARDGGVVVSAFDADGAPISSSWLHPSGPAPAVHALEADADENVYLAGSAVAEDSPPEVRGLGYPGGFGDLFVMKVDPDLETYFATRFGGAGVETFRAFDVEGPHIVVAGDTLSTDLPTVDAFQTNLAGMIDAFVLRMTSDDRLSNQRETYEVNSTGDAPDADPSDETCDTGATVGGAPECTLRAAMMAANARTGRTDVRFDLMGAGPHVISVGSALPLVTQSMSIVGEGIVIDGTGVAANGLEFYDAPVTVEGVVVRNFGGHGVLFASSGVFTLNAVEARSNCGCGVVSNGDLVVADMLQRVSRFVDNGLGTGCIGAGIVVLQEGAGTVLRAKDIEASGNGGPGIYVRGRASLERVDIRSNKGDGVFGPGNVSLPDTGARFILGMSPVDPVSVIASNRGHGINAFVEGGIDVRSPFEIRNNSGFGLSAGDLVDIADANVRVFENGVEEDCILYRYDEDVDALVEDERMPCARGGIRMQHLTARMYGTLNGAQIVDNRGPGVASEGPVRLAGATVSRNEGDGVVIVAGDLDDDTSNWLSVRGGSGGAPTVIEGNQGHGLSLDFGVLSAPAPMRIAGNAGAGIWCDCTKVELDGENSGIQILENQRGGIVVNDEITAKDATITDNGGPGIELKLDTSDETLAILERVELCRNQGGDLVGANETRLQMSNVCDDRTAPPDADDEEDDGGCTTTGGETSFVWLLLALVVWIRSVR